VAAVAQLKILSISLILSCPDGAVAGGACHASAWADKTGVAASASSTSSACGFTIYQRYDKALLTVK
jgi:hypothetical protein